MAQFNKAQMHRKLQGDLRSAYRVLLNYDRICENRIPATTDKPDLNILWRQLELACDIARDNFIVFWSELQEIRTEYGRTTLNPADLSSLGEARLDKVMATSNVLTRAQKDNGFTAVSDFPSAAANRFEKFYEVLSATHDLAIKVRSRSKYWRGEWRTLSPDNESDEMVALLRRINIAANFLKTFCEDIAQGDNSRRSRGVRKAFLRKKVSRPAINLVTGDIALLNQDDPDAGDPTNPLQLLDPDINYARDVPELGVDV